MKIATITIAVVFIVALCCCSENNNHTHNAQVNQSEYPAIVDSLGLQKQYDETKWRMYCNYCDKKVFINPLYGIKDTFTFGQMPLKYWSFNQIGKDTIELLFSYMYRDTIPCNYNYVHGIGICGIAYSIAKDTLLYFRGEEVFRISVWCDVPCNERLVNPLQPEVIKYITDNKNKLNPWFYKEAIKRGLLYSDSLQHAIK
jgi:hypothetical protein